MASADSGQAATLLEGTFNLQGKSCTVTLTSQSLKLQPAKGKKKDEVVIPIEEILAVTTAAAEKAKNEDNNVLQVAYIKHKKKTILARATLKLAATSDVCARWSQNIQDGINRVSLRPRNALVLINPVSGNGKGPKQYNDKVAPLFTEASVKTDVKVTESADHVKEIIDGYDLDSIDSLMVVGGDGMYHLVADALMQRRMREAGLDLNNTEVDDIPEITLPIGIIPCGTGNGIAASCYGCYELETAVLGIIRGGRQKLNLHSVWSGGEFLVYSSLLQGFGVMADLIYETASRRNLGRMRYPVVIGGYLFKSSVRMLDVTIDYRQPAVLAAKPDAAQADDEDEDSSTLAESGRQPWQTYQGTSPMLGVFLADQIGYRDTRNPAHLKFSRIYVMKQWGRVNYFKFFLHLMTLNPAMLRNTNFDHMPFTEYKVRLNNPEEQNGHELLMNIDGEVFYLKKPEYHVRVFPGKMNLFASVTEEFLLTV